MKKIFILLLIPIIITGCTKKENTPINLDKKMDISVSTYQDDNPITVGLYEDEYLIKEYQTNLTNMKDITVFNIYYTNQEILENNYIKYNWNKYYNTY